MKFVAIALPVILIAAAGLAGCDQTEKPASASVSRDAMNSPDIENVSSVKLDLYTRAYYLLMNSPDSLRPSYNTFHQARKAKIPDDIRFSSSASLEKGLELFKKGLAIHGGGMDDLDEAVRDTLLAGFRLQKDELELEPYFRKQEYRDDQLAKAKASYMTIQADYEAMFGYMDKIETLLFKYRKTESEKRMAVFREKKDWLGYYTEESLLNAPGICWRCSVNRMIRSKIPTCIPEAMKFFFISESSLVSQRKAFEEARKNNTKHIGDYSAIDRIPDKLYRELSRSQATQGNR